MGKSSKKDEAAEITEANQELLREQDQHPDTTDQLPRVEQGRDSVRPQPADEDEPRDLPPR